MRATPLVFLLGASLLGCGASEDLADASALDASRDGGTGGDASVTDLAAGEDGGGGDRGASVEDATSGDGPESDAGLSTSDGGPVDGDSADSGPPPSNEGWPKTFDSGSDDFGWATAVDEAGNVYFAVTFGGASIDLLGGPLVPPGSSRLALVSYTPDGHHRWSRVVDEPIQHLAARGGALYALAVTRGPGGSGDTDFVLTRYTSAGVREWTRTASGAGHQDGNGIGVDALGNAYVGGSFDTTLDLGEGRTYTSSGSYDAFVASFDPAGDPRWSHVISDDEAVLIHGLAVDDRGNSYATGALAGTITFAGRTVTDRGLGDAFIASLDPGGTARWITSFPGNANDRGERAAVRTGTVCAAGLFGGTASFGVRSLTSGGSFLDVFVVCAQSSDGTPIWASSFGGTGNGRNTPKGIAIDDLGRVFVAGTHRDTGFRAGGASVGYAGALDADLVTFGPSGGVITAIGWGSAEDDQAFAVATSSRAAFVTGGFRGTIDFGDGPRAASAGDVFMVRASP